MMKFKVIIIGMFLFLNISTVQAFDVELFNKLANNTIKQVKMGVVGDIDEMIQMQEELMVIGVMGGMEFLQSGVSGANDTKPLILVIENAEKMKDMSLEEIESLWHAGNFLKSIGIDPETIDHFGPMRSLMDSVIHPATSYLLLKEYKQTGNTDLLVRVKAELFEVLEHVKQVNNARPIKLSINE